VSKSKHQNYKGFTLLEVLLVVAIISILAGIVIIAISPNKNLADSRNSQRKADVNTILSAVYQYALDNNGVVPASITTTPTEICVTTGATCSGKVDLGVVTANEKYITAIPKDPQCVACGTTGAGYVILKTANNRITVNAPEAEEGQTISVTR
jgi:prepilin-type N-terminal cleavage/methylation domain-containing protein